MPEDDVRAAVDWIETALAGVNAKRRRNVERRKRDDVERRKRKRDGKRDGGTESGTGPLLTESGTGRKAGRGRDGKRDGGTESGTGRKAGRVRDESGTGPLLQYGQAEKLPDLAISDLSRFPVPLPALSRFPLTVPLPTH